MRTTAAIVIALLCSTATVFGADGLACFEQPPKPDYPAQAIAAGIEASVWTTVEVGDQGALKSLDTEVIGSAESATAGFAAAVEKAVRATKLKAECAGQTVDIAFRFQKNADKTPLAPEEVSWVVRVPAANVTQSAER